MQAESEPTTYFPWVIIVFCCITYYWWVQRMKVWNFNETSNDSNYKCPILKFFWFLPKKCIFWMSLESRHAKLYKSGYSTNFFNEILEAAFTHFSSSSNACLHITQIILAEVVGFVKRSGSVYMELRKLWRWRYSPSVWHVIQSHWSTSVFIGITGLLHLKALAVSEGWTLIIAQVCE